MTACFTKHGLHMPEILTLGKKKWEDLEFKGSLSFIAHWKAAWAM